MADYIDEYLQSVISAIKAINTGSIERVIDLLVLTRLEGGRLFILGVGGSAANASHAVNDFRKLTGLETYTPVDNVSELTARTNDEGWPTVFEAWLRTSKLKSGDMVLVFSVGGGSLEKDISSNLVHALQYARQAGARIAGIVGRDGGYTAQVANACVIVPSVSSTTVTPLTESFQAIIWHLMVTHPKLKIADGKWESVQ